MPIIQNSNRNKDLKKTKNMIIRIREKRTKKFAHQWTGKETPECEQFISRCEDGVQIVDKKKEFLLIRENDIQCANVGDWIIRNEVNQFKVKYFICSKKDFEDKYEKF